MKSLFLSSNVLINFCLLWFLMINVVDSLNITKLDESLDEDGDEIILTETEQERMNKINMTNNIYHHNETKMIEEDNSTICGGPGWYRYGEKCYFLHGDMAGSTMHDAITICERYHRTHLLTIHSTEETNYLTKLLFDKLVLEFSVWLGLVRVNETDFIWLDDQNDHVDDGHVDHRSLNYTNWAPNEPNNLHQKHYCVVMSSERVNGFLGKWYDVSCSGLFLVVCEKPIRYHSNETAPIFNFWNVEDNETNKEDEIISDFYYLIKLLTVNLILSITMMAIVILWIIYRYCYSYRKLQLTSKMFHNELEEEIEDSDEETKQRKKSTLFSIQQMFNPIRAKPNNQNRSNPTKFNGISIQSRQTNSVIETTDI